MASILRSSKFVRYIVGFTRNVTVNPVRDLDTTAIQNGQCLCSILTRSLASQNATQHSTNDLSLEKSIKRLDQDVRRSGRISRRDIEDILDEIRHSQSPSSSQSLLIIRCCGNLVPEEQPEIRTKLVQEIWKTLNKLNVPMDVSHYNALLRVYLENEYEFSPVEFLAELEKQGIEPNRVTYQRLISRYCQKGDIEGATKILEFMKEKQLPVNENVFNALIMGHSQADDMESAKGILGVMQQAGLEPSADTYTTLLCGYARKGDITSISDTIKSCEEKEITLLDKDYMDIIYALATNGHGSYAPELLSKMRKSFGYNQDCINLILKLINKNQEEVALEVLKSMTRGTSAEEKAPVGGFFISQMVKSKRPVEKIISIAKYLENENLNPRALLIAADSALKEANLDMALPILKEIQKHDLPVRSHYFWPLIITESKKNGNDGVQNVLKTMISTFNLSVTGETIRDYAIPHMKFTTPDQCILMLRDTGVSVASAASNLVYHYLVNNDLKNAADVAFRYSSHYSPVLLKRPLALTYLRTKDTESYIKLVRQIHDNLKRADTALQSSQEDNETVEDASSTTSNRFDPPHVVGQLVLDIAVIGKNDRAQNLSDVLLGLINEGLSISNKSAERLQELLGEKITPEITTYLSKLTSGELTPIPLIKSASKNVTSIPNAIQLEKSIKIAEERGENVNGLKRQLLSIYCKNKETEKVETFLQNLKSDFEITNGIYAQLIDLYCSVENLDKALHYKQKLYELDPNFCMDDVKVIKLVSLLCKNNRIDDAIEYLKIQSRERKLDERTFGYNNQCWKLLMTLAEEGKTEDLKKLFNTLIEKDYIEISNVMLGPLIKVHLVNNDLPKAIEEFEECCQKYRCTPFKNELTCKLIQNEDATNLQKLTDLSTSIHGEVNSLYDLVFAFVECGRVRQARKILETPGLRNRQQRVNSICERYSLEGQTDPLEGLIEATKDLHHIDRSNIFLHLLNSYIKQDDVDKALGLWTRMQEEDTQPSDEFLLKLGSFLKTKERNVPFTIPQKSAVKKPESISPQSSQSRKEDEAIASNDLKAFRTALKNFEIDKALELRNKINPSQLSLLDTSSVIETLVQSERLNEAKKEVMNMINTNAYPIPRVFRFFLNKLALSGDVDTLNAIGEKLKPELKKLVSFDNRLCHANIVAGKSTEFLSSLDSIIENAKDEQLPDIANQFPRGGAMGILESHPELVPRFEEIAIKYANRGIIAPANVLWMKYFISKNTEDANRIWEKYLKDSPRIMFQRIVQYARESKDDELARQLIQVLKSTKVTEGAFGNAYSCLLDVLVAKEEYEVGLKELQNAVNDVCLENINRTALTRLKQGLTQLGKPFPYEIPPKNAKSSSSSSSDDEKKK
ncbi:leucine-rich PPR motif-containing protein, mitochondrial [Chrysoperla carnea]|uniref:leucine-rich PPR motif-containing protein, mitochondrial n=1 Tax=Chrysoperla carnea TaxID=189513 RepID=UPI001D0899C6|nr:leucine-rich PPR motif-containing protein, mitochondrial [Chrysoperla carnea]